MLGGKEYRPRTKGKPTPPGPATSGWPSIWKRRLGRPRDARSFWIRSHMSARSMARWSGY